MKLETFFEKFDRFANAPDAVAKIRELVLELAVQGKLVERRPGEGDGHALLKLIHKKKPPSEIEPEVDSVDAELPSFPNSWARSKLGEVAEIIRGVSFPGSAKSETKSDGDVACLRTASVQAEIDWDDLIYISPSHVSRVDQWVAPNDIMISMANSYALVGKVAIVREVLQKATFGAFLAAIRPVLIEPYFLLYVLRSPRMQAAFRASSSQTTNIANISLGRMRPLPFPLPPLAEQKRIVAKVDELMALCDRLEGQQKERETRHAALSRASLARFADAPTPANLEFIFHKSYDITPADLRKSILTLAVQGKLGTHHTSDDPFDAVYIKNEKRKSEGDVLESEHFIRDIPLNWRWIRFEWLGDVFGGHTPSMNRPDYWAGAVPWVSPKDMHVDRITGTEMHVTDKAIAETGMRIVKPGSVIFVTRSGILKRMLPVAVNLVQCVVNQDLKVLTPKYTELTPFLRLMLRGHEPMILRELVKTGTTVQSLKFDEFRNKAFPIPPISEQRRIVDRVEELMALVEELERQLVAARATAANLLEAVVAELTTPNTREFPHRGRKEALNSENRLPVG